MNFTWFASAYDTDDVAVPHRSRSCRWPACWCSRPACPRAFERRDFSRVTVGYVIMRVGARRAVAARRDRASARPRDVPRATPIGVAVVQIGWVAWLLLARRGWLRGVPACWSSLELLVPVWAERPGADAVASRHIAERYGLFTIIVLGESVLAATGAVQARARREGPSPDSLVTIGVGGLIIAVRDVVDLLPAAGRRRARPSPQSLVLLGLRALLAVRCRRRCRRRPRDRGPGARPPRRGVRDDGGLAVAVPVALVLILVWVLHRPLVRHSEVPAFAVFPSAALMLVAALAAPAIGLPGVVVAVAALTARWSPSPSG